MMTVEQAFLKLLSDSQYEQIMENSYISFDLVEAGTKFELSTEFAEVLHIIGSYLLHAVVLDLGAGNGIASYAFARAGASKVIALEPDPSKIIGREAIRKMCIGLPVEILESYGEAISLPDQSVDIVYARQVLHHTHDLGQVLSECHRVLKPGGMFLACREHVVSNDKQLASFLSNHPVHQLAGNENAYRLEEYTSAIVRAGFADCKVLRTWDSVINAFPAVCSAMELEHLPETFLRKRLGRIGASLSHISLIRSLVFRILNRPTPGQLYSFIARKAA